MEWERRKIEIDIQSFPMFRLLVASIDDVGPKREEVNRKTFQFDATDLLCYRAEDPPDLINSQEKKWQPKFKWVEEEFMSLFGLQMAFHQFHNLRKRCVQWEMN